MKFRVPFNFEGASMQEKTQAPGLAVSVRNKINSGESDTTKSPQSEIRRLFAMVQNYIVTEELVVLVEFVFVALVGLIVFANMYSHIESLVTGISHALTKLGVSRLFQ